MNGDSERIAQLISELSQQVELLSEILDEAKTEILWPTRQWNEDSDALDAYLRREAIQSIQSMTGGIDELPPSSCEVGTPMTDMIERLKVCATCRHGEEWNDYDVSFTYCTLMPHNKRYAVPYDEMVDPRDPCHLTPSQWSPYWGAPKP